MRWLLHGPIAGSVAEALRQRGDEAAAAGELGVPADAPVAEVVRAAQKGQRDIVTADAACATAPFDERIPFDRCIVYLRVAADDAAALGDAVGRFFERYPRP